MPRNKELNEKIKEDRKEQILKTSLRLFATKGLASVTTNEIARECEISGGLIYHYFESKEDIYTHLIGNAYDRMIAAWKWLDAQPMPPEQKIRKAIEGLLGGLEGDKDSARYYMLIMQAFTSEALPDDVKKILRDKGSVPFEILSGIIRDGQAKDTIKRHNTSELATAFWGMINGMAILRVIDNKRYKFPSAEVIIEMFIKNHIEEEKKMTNQNENNKPIENEYIVFPKSILAQQDSLEITVKEADKILRQSFPSGRLINLPKKQKKKLVILNHLAELFEADRNYAEGEINSILMNKCDDHVTIRRYLIEFGFMGRTSDGREYWRQV